MMAIVRLCALGLVSYLLVGVAAAIATSNGATPCPRHRRYVLPLPHGLRSRLAQGLGASLALGALSGQPPQVPPGTASMEPIPVAGTARDDPGPGAPPDTTQPAAPDAMRSSPAGGAPSGGHDGAGVDQPPMTYSAAGRSRSGARNEGSSDPPARPRPAGSPRPDGQLDEGAPTAEPDEPAEPGILDGPGTAGTVRVVAPGDSLWLLAEEELADRWGRVPSERETGAYWRRVVEANRDHVRSGDPDVLYPGEIVTLPA